MKSAYLRRLRRKQKVARAKARDSAIAKQIEIVETAIAPVVVNLRGLGLSDGLRATTKHAGTASSVPV
jgi:hypothetical protein